MKTKFFKRLFVLVLLVGIAFSCQGPEGPAGKDGKDGIDGRDGRDGVDGQDGNANVQTYVYNNPSWNSTGSGMTFQMTGILTQDVIDNDVILVYVKNPNDNHFYSVPGLVWCGSYIQYRHYTFYVGVNNLTIVSLEKNGNFTPNSDLYPMEKAKIIIIESTNTTTTNGNGSRPAKYKILDKMEKDGVDLNDYYQVCDYLNIEP